MTPLRVTLKRDLHLDHGVVLAGSKGRIYDSGRGDGSLCVRFDAEQQAARHYAGELLLVPFDCEDVIDAFCVSPRNVLDTYVTLPPMANRTSIAITRSYHKRATSPVVAERWRCQGIHN